MGEALEQICRGGGDVERALYQVLAPGLSLIDRNSEGFFAAHPFRIITSRCYGLRGTRAALQVH